MRQTWRVMLAVTQIAADGSVLRRVLDTNGRSDIRRWEELTSRAPAFPPPYRSAPGGAVFHVRVDDHVLMVGEEDLSGPLRDLVMAVLAEGATL